MKRLFRSRVGPRKVRIEASSACQLRCPLCPTGKGELGPVVGTGVLTLADFERFLERNPGVREVELSNWGEMFLAPELSDILRVAHERGVVLAARNGVNLNTASEAVLEDLVRYRFRSLVVSIDGASQETYAKYRVKGDFERVIANVKAINRFKARQRSSLPLLTWKFILFRHNQHEIARARALAAELGMLFYPDLNWDENWEPPDATPEVRQGSGLAITTIAEHEQRFRTRYVKDYCLQLWNEPQVNWDGKILGCCVNVWGDFGSDAFGGPLETEKLGYARRMLLGQAPPRADVPCTTCERYLERQRDAHWVTPAQILSDALQKRLKELVHALVARLPGRGASLSLLARAAAWAR